jgi:hypothetical protein
MTDLRLDAIQRTVAAAEVEAVLSAATEPTRRVELADLLAEVGAGEVGKSQLDLLDRIVELGLHTGRIRALHGPSGEAAATRLHRRLPSGAAAAASANDVSAALGSLAGRTLDDVELAAAGAGAFTLTLVAGGRRLAVRLDRNGARLASVEA